MTQVSTIATPRMHRRYAIDGEKPSSSFGKSTGPAGLPVQFEFRKLISPVQIEAEVGDGNVGLRHGPGPAAGSVAVR